MFLFDEPLSNLDAKLRVQMRAEIARLHQRLKTTMIYVTHDQVEAMTLGERIVLMDRGVVQQVDSPLNIYRRPANRFVASFIGSPAMNFFAGEMRGGEFHFAGRRHGPPTCGDEWSLPPARRRSAFAPKTCSPTATACRWPRVALDVVEHMGHETMVHFELAGQQHVARLPRVAAANSRRSIVLGNSPGGFPTVSAATRRACGSIDRPEWPRIDSSPTARYTAIRGNS